MNRHVQQHHQVMPHASSPEMGDAGLIIKVLMVNGDSRSLRIYKWYTVTDVLRDILPRLRVNMEVALDMFGIQFRNALTKECYWLQPGYPILQLVHEYSSATSVVEWQFLLLIRILPKTPQHISDVDPISFQYFYDQVLHQYLSDESLVVDNGMAVSLGCLELRRFFKDMPHAALKKKENFTMLEKEIGLEKFFKRSLLQTVRKKPLRTLVLAAFKEYEHLTTESCVFQFFNLLTRFHRIDEDFFTNCAVGANPPLPFSSVLFVGPNCNIEYQDHRVRRFLCAFMDIQGISSEAEMMERGKIVLEMKNSPAIVVHTAHLMTAIDMASLIDSYCIVYTDNSHSRLTGVKRFSNSNMSEGVYNTIDELRMQQQKPLAPLPGTIPLSYSMFGSPNDSSEYCSIPGSDMGDPDQYEAMPMKMYRTIAPQDLFLRDKIGEGQFGDVHNGFLYPKTPDEKEVAIKTCKEDASNEDRAKFLEEALVMCKFKHPNIIKLYGVVSHMDLAYIVMELAPHGQLRRYLLVEGARISRLMLLHYISQLSSAMVHLEDMNYVHRDIAARNILVCNRQTIKLADFGLSRVLEDGDYYVASRGKLPIKWMAPESINFRRFTGLSDVWMFGVCCWEILMRGVKPFVGIKNDEVISKIESGDRLPLPAECPPALFSLMNVCWNYDPLERPRFIEIEAKTLDIIEEESKTDEMASRWFNQDISENPISPIQRDPDAPTKPIRQYPPGEYPAVRVSSISSEMLRDENVVPPLPPRAMERFRELSSSPPSIDDGSINQLVNANIPPPRGLQKVHSNDQLRGLTIAEGLPNSSVSSTRIIPPYSVTTINPPRTHVESPPPSHVQQQKHPHQPSTHAHDNSTQGNQALNSHVPPPAILAQHPSHLQQQQQQSSSSGQCGDPDPDTGIYYSTAQDVIPEKKQQRMLNKDGVFVSREISSLREGTGGVRPRIAEDRSISRASTEESSGKSSPAASSDERRYSPRQRTSGGDVEQAHMAYVMQEEDDILKQTTGVVKSVKELSDKIHKCKPNDYIDLVKNVGLALRDLLGKVDIVLGEMPSEVHTEVLMAQKVLSSDMNQLVKAMKDAQSHYDRFLEQEYQKKMLKAAHVVAVNSKLLLDAVNSARQKASLMR